MTASTSIQSQPRKPTARPTLWRLLASKYVDILICGFIAWIVCYAFGWQTNWPSLSLFLWVGEFIWCRDRLNPTAGEFCLGIRYLTSSSSHVVAEIQVIQAKLKLNGYLLFAGVTELTLAILFFSGWTFFTKVVVWGFLFAGPFSLVYWIVAGLAFFLCSGYLLSGSKNALWVVPVIHLIFLVDFVKSSSDWRSLVDGIWIFMPIVHLLKDAPFHWVGLFGLWSLFLLGVLALSRKHLVN